MWSVWFAHGGPPVGGRCSCPLRRRTSDGVSKRKPGHRWDVRGRCDAATVNALELAGLIIQILGTGIAAEAVLGNARMFGRNPFEPAWTRFRTWLARRLGRSIPAHVGGGGGLTVWAGAAAGRGYVGLREDAPLEEQVPWLRQRVEQLQDEIRELRELIATTRRESIDQVAEIRDESRTGQAKLEEKLSNVAAGRVRQELAGLFFVVLGTFVSSLG
jgi:hypothetical protein